ncbi:CCR4A [Auxenochlorella protothecoides x Auxenochlorella symbiontica]
MGKKKANKRKGALAAHYDSVDLVLKDVTLSLINFERHINDVRQLETDAQKDTARASAGIELEKLVQGFGLLTSCWFKDAEDRLKAEIKRVEKEMECLMKDHHFQATCGPALQFLEDTGNRHRSHLQFAEQVIPLMDMGRLTAEELHGTKGKLESYLRSISASNTVSNLADETFSQILSVLRPTAKQSPFGSVFALEAGSTPPRSRQAQAGAFLNMLDKAGFHRLYRVLQERLEAESSPSKPGAGLQEQPAPLAAASALASEPHLYGPVSLADKADLLYSQAESPLADDSERCSDNTPRDAGLSSDPQLHAIQPTLWKYPRELYKLLDAETLFFAFHHLPGTRAQLLAAQELYRQDWRYHMWQGVWFQRYAEPTAGGQPGDDWEKGSYIYFDYLLHGNGHDIGWCYRLKEDFLFQYAALADAITIE